MSDDGWQAAQPQNGRADFADFVRARTAALWRVAFLLTGDRHHAEDLLQVALEKAAVRWEGLDSPEAYVRRVLYTQAVSWWRARQRRVREVLTDETPEPAGPAADPELRLVLAQALRRLTAKQRAVLVLRYYEDCSEREAAVLLNVTAGTVKAHTRHALRRLRELAPELAGLLGETAAPPPAGPRPAGKSRGESAVAR